MLEECRVDYWRKKALIFFMFLFEISFDKKSVMKNLAECQKELCFQICDPDFHCTKVTYCRVQRQCGVGLYIYFFLVKLGSQQHLFINIYIIYN